MEVPLAPTVRAPAPDPTDEREEETELSQTGLRRRGESPANRHREATVTAPLLDSTHHRVGVPLDEEFREVYGHRGSGWFAHGVVVFPSVGEHVRRVLCRNARTAGRCDSWNCPSKRCLVGEKSP